MKVLLFLPFAPDSPTGNAVTARRIRKNLAPMGVEVVLEHLPPDATLDHVLAAVDREMPDVLTWYNAWKTGRWLPDTKRARALPSVVTLTGTDINREAEDPEHGERVLRTLREAEAVVTYSSALRDHVASLLPEVSERIHTIPKGVELGSDRYDLPSWATGDVVLFLLPAGIRPEKNNAFALRALDAAHEADPRVRLLLAGPVIDERCGAALREELARRPWTGHIERIPHEAMASVYAQSAVVLNTSLSEGMANAVIEAMACGRPVLASDIEGNRQVIADGETGLLYRNEADFVARATELVASAALRERLGAAARAEAARRFSPAAEARELHRVLWLVRDRALGLRRIEGGYRDEPPGGHMGVPQRRLPEVARFLPLTAGEPDEELRSELGQNPALTVRSTTADTYDPHEPPPPPTFEGAGVIAEARSERVHADHAAWLVGEAIARDRAEIAGKVVWEVGCGSGVLAALCARLGAREVWATDVDREAVALADATARLNDVSVRLRRASLMEMEGDLHPDVVIANLPQKPVPPGVTVAIANDGGPDGTRLLVPFLQQARERIPRGGRLYCFRHSLCCDPPVLELLLDAFDVVRVRTRRRIFHEDEFPELLPYWRERRKAGLCAFDDLGEGRYAFLCAALTCVRR